LRLPVFRLMMAGFSPKDNINMAIATAEAFAPATIANLGVGFDIVGLALREPGDHVRAEWSDEPGMTVTSITGDGGRLPRDAAKNTACVAAQSVLRLVGESRGVRLTIDKGLPLASGLGSSAASAVAGAVAVNALLGSPLSKGELLPACLDGEEMASGRHADNVAPCLFGGITLIYGTNASQIVQLPIPDNLYFALVTPAVEVPTKRAREALPPTVSLRTMVAQTAGVARLIDAIHRGDLVAMGAAMESDSVIEPARQSLMPLLTEIRSAAKAAGALGLAISGAGPTLCAVCAGEATALRVTTAMHAVYALTGIPSQSRWTQVASTGARTL
jgi:homoserine kinase